jgi:TRAP-type C4-dicarboxylate transport system permease small subunit
MPDQKSRSEAALQSGEPALSPSEAVESAALENDERPLGTGGDEEPPIAIESVTRPAAPSEPKAAWGTPLAKLDAKWTSLESRLCGIVLLAEIGALCFWILMKGLSSGGSTSGIVLRSMLTGTVLAYAAHFALRAKAHSQDRRELLTYRAAVTSALVIGLLLGPRWANLGRDYFSNLLNWMQTASVLMLIGGLRGLATRLTLWLALLGASIATAKGKHINVDVVMRFLTPKTRVHVALVTWSAAAFMCVAAAIGFTDHIAIESYKAPAFKSCAGDASQVCDTTPGEKMSHVLHGVRTDLFLLGRQISLDLKSLPRVLSGQTYSSYLTAPEWNAWVREGGWVEHFGEDAVAELLLPDDPAITRAPAVSVPGGTENAAGLLIREANFIFPFGLLVLAIRFILRGLLALSGHVKVDPDAAHEEDELPEEAAVEGAK